MALRVHMLEEPDRELLDGLEPLLGKDIVLTCSRAVPDPADYEVLISGVPDPEAMEASPHLRLLIIPWSGLPRRTRELMLKYPHVRVHNIHHNAAPAAEMAVTLMLAAAKDLIPIDRDLRGGDWTRRYRPSSARLIEESRALVLGYGAIGRRIATACLGLCMRVRAIAAGGLEEAHPEIEIHPRVKIPGLLPVSDVLFLSLPLTSETEGLIGARELALLPDGAILVNVSRGAIVDEEALYAELERGRLRAGLDVWYDYPGSKDARKATEPSSYPFGELPNVVMTPHLAGHCERTEELRARELSRLLNLAAKGEPLPNRVDLQSGY
jgi:phosphoglycerate dehydrogenase-like enzyme